MTEAPRRVAAKKTRRQEDKKTRRQEDKNRRTGGRHHGWQPCQPHPGTRYNRCGCSLPGLTGFTANHCEGTDRVTIACPAYEGRAIVTACAQVTTINSAQCTGQRLRPCATAILHG